MREQRQRGKSGGHTACTGHGTVTVTVRGQHVQGQRVFPTLLAHQGPASPRGEAGRAVICHQLVGGFKELMKYLFSFISCVGGRLISIQKIHSLYFNLLHNSISPQVCLYSETGAAAVIT